MSADDPYPRLAVATDRTSAVQRRAAAPPRHGASSPHGTRRACVDCGVHTMVPEACRNCGGTTLPLAEVRAA
jgi:hypothetical protein